MPTVPVVRSLRRVVRPRVPRPVVDLSHPARSPLGTSVVSCVAYDREGTRLMAECGVAEALACVRKGGAAGDRNAGDGGGTGDGGFVWIGLHEPGEAEFEGITELFGLHPLAVENALEPHQRPKAEWYGGEMMFAVFKTVSYVEHEKVSTTSEVVDTGEIVVFTGADFVITVRHGRHGSLGPLREELESDPERLAQGPAAVLHAIADRVVDDYLLVADEVQTDIDELESQVFASERPFGGSGSGGGSGTSRVYQIKRELLELKRATLPLARPLELLSDRPNRLIDPEIRKYFRDVADHLARVTEQIASFDALLDSILQAHLAQVSTAQNEGMRKISAWVAIVAVPTMVCGIYGMNFERMPELHWRLGYPLVLAVIAVTCVAMYRAFRRNGWL
ncbi:magnesium transporter CorA [Streptomyces qinglanensis]|uniref:Magnesium transporter CorA n=1 Tax=Streptomyces qinglanensis TaxID=943816 RepID=A0A1E7KDS2_9ACTN|nr:magnesium and cobalt transport protein CorA [Streptomyces qinglanensis]OEV02069.1 magnesium transporter CorA [Streptomyces qinglanensis]OEV07707.1 magnesium transporter CorA [Streptomyces nanshensis]